MLITTYIQLKEDKTEIRKQSKTPRPCTFLVVSHFQHGESSWCGDPSLNCCHTFCLLHLEHQDCPMLENPQGNLTASAILLSSFYSLTFLIKWLYPLNVSETQVSRSPLNISNIQEWWILSSMGMGLRLWSSVSLFIFTFYNFFGGVWVRPQLWTSEHTWRDGFLFPSCGLKDWTHVIRLSTRRLYPLSHLVDLRRHCFSTTSPIMVRNKSSKWMVTFFHFSVLGIKPRPLFMPSKSVLPWSCIPSLPLQLPCFKISRARYSRTYL